MNPCPVPDPSDIVDHAVVHDVDGPPVDVEHILFLEVRHRESD
jgi:hypothetical protein